MKAQSLGVLGAAMAALAISSGWTVSQEGEEKKLPEFVLKSTDGGTLSLKYENGQALIARKAGTVKAKAVLLHFFQPDCHECLTELKALQTLQGELTGRDVALAGVAYRGEDAAVSAAAEKLKVTLPILLGKGSNLADRFSRGDTTLIADAKGVVRYSQVSFREGDEKTFKQRIEGLLVDKGGTAGRGDRKELAVGDEFPSLKLPSLMSGKPGSLSVEGGKLTYRDESGKESRPKVAVGFFSRY